MRLAFICSGLEPGRDGIGDFTRALAAACTAAGHETRLVAVRDPHRPKDSPVTDPSSLEPRFQDIFCNPTEANALDAWLREFKPDWVSVQYTPFGFHPRGLGVGRAAWLRQLLPPGTRRHFMLHEIWLHPGPEGTWRQRVLGWCQHWSVDAWTRTGWQPEVVQTQARLHQKRLLVRGVKAGLLPLCNTFAPADTPVPAARAAVIKRLEASGRPAPRDNDAGLWIGHFGTLHNQIWDFNKFAAEFTVQAAQAGKRVCFIALGRGQTITKAWAEAAQAVPAAEFHVLGELSEKEVAVTMNACDAAFTTTPWDIIEKSSAVAAWRAAGVRVLVTRGSAPHSSNLPPWPDSGLFLADGTTPVFSGPFQRIPGPAFLNPSLAAQTFLSALASAPANRS